MFPWLSVIGAVPLVGSGALALLPRGRDLLAKRAALLVALLVLALTVAMAVRFDPNAGVVQFARTLPWIPQFGVSYAVGVDGIALVLIGLTAVLVPMVILGGWNEVGAEAGAQPASGTGAEAGGEPGRGARSVKTYFSLLLLVEFTAIAVFAARDLFLFYVFFEAMLVPMYFIIGAHGGPQRSYAAVKFLLYSLFGGLLMLAAVIALFALSAQGPGGGTFLLSALTDLQLGLTTQIWLFLGFFVAFAIKAPMWPFHTWLPDAAAEAPPAGGAVLLVGVLDKVGTFGMLTLCLPLFPDAAQLFAPAIVVLSVIGVLYGALLAVGQTDLKRLIAYTSISHFGLITLGIFAFTMQGQVGATLYMVNHGFVTGALFLIIGFLVARRHSQRIPDYGGVGQVAPVLAGSFLLVGLAGLALPGLNAFVSEFLVLVGTFVRYQVAAGFAAAGIILAALYILWMFQRTMTGPAREQVQGMRDLSRRELAAIAPLMAVIVGLGFYPKPVIEMINPAVERTMAEVGVDDPTPRGPVAEDGAAGSGAQANAPGEATGASAPGGAAERTRVTEGS